MTSSPTLQIELTVEEGQLIVEALAERSFRSVFELIGKLNRRANEVAMADDASDAREFLLTAPDLLLTLNALGDMPFNRVNGLVDKLKHQMQLQLALAADAATAGQHGKQ